MNVYAVYMYTYRENEENTLNVVRIGRNNYDPPDSIYVKLIEALK